MKTPPPFFLLLLFFFFTLSIFGSVKKSALFPFPMCFTALLEQMNLNSSLLVKWMVFGCSCQYAARSGREFKLLVSLIFIILYFFQFYAAPLMFPLF